MRKIVPPTFQQMRLFEAVARHGSMTRAAEEVHLTQPSVSMQVKTLEDKIGLKLTRQKGRALRLTRAGEEVAAASRDVLARLTDMQERLQDMHHEVAGPLSVAVVSTAKYFLPQLLGHFKRRHPGVEPQLVITNRERVLARIADDADDLYIIGRPPAADTMVVEPFLENVIGFVARPEHPLVGEKDISLSRIAQENVIRREPGSGTRQAVDQLCREAGVALQTHLEFDDPEAIKQGVIAGLGVAYLSLHALKLELESGQLALLDVAGFPLRRQWYAAHLRGKRLSNAATGFLAFLKQESGGPPGV